MSTPCLVLSSVFLAATGLLLAWVGALHRRLRALQAQQQALSETWQSEQADLSGFLGGKPRPLLTIEILDAVELAARESRVARVMGKCAPDTLRKLVYKSTAENMRKQMAQHGMQVEIRVHGFD